MSAELFDSLAEAVRADRPVALATVVSGLAVGAKILVRSGAEALGSLGDGELDRVVLRDIEGQLATGTSLIRRYGMRGEALRDDVAVFIQVFVPPPHMLIVGATEFSAALARVAKVLGYRVTVCDPRPVFATAARFPSADSVLVGWPDEILARLGPSLTRRDAVCVLSHDVRFDVPAIVGALATGAGYLGAMGSRRTDRERAQRLRAAGVDDAGLARVRSPIGLDLGARTPEETAVSICAEIIAARAGQGPVVPLGATDGPIHAR